MTWTPDLPAPSLQGLMGMNTAPERIWAVPLEMNGAVMVGGWADTIRQCPNGTEYVRADIHAQTLAANAALMKRLDEAQDALDSLLEAITACDRFCDRSLTITGPTYNLKWLLEAEDDARAVLAELDAAKEAANG